MTTRPAAGRVPALTLTNPWGAAIAWHRKDVENRTWRPPASVSTFMIHAGVGDDRFGYDDMKRRGIAIGPYVTRRAIVAVATLAGVCDLDDRGGTGLCDCGPWAQLGQLHWRLGHVRTLAVPVPCNGRQRLWWPPDEVQRAVGAVLRVGVIPLRCRGQAHDGGPVCGAVYEAKGLNTHAVHQPDRPATWQQDHYEKRARVAGWHIEPGPIKLVDRSVMCPDCARPDPAITRGLTTGARS